MLLPFTTAPLRCLQGKVRAKLQNSLTTSSHPHSDLPDAATQACASRSTAAAVARPTHAAHAFAAVSR